MRTSCKKSLGDQRAVEQQIQELQARVRLLSSAAAAAEAFCRRTAGVDGPTFNRLREMFDMWRRAEARLRAAEEAAARLRDCHRPPHQ